MNTDNQSNADQQQDLPKPRRAVMGAKVHKGGKITQDKSTLLPEEEKDILKKPAKKKGVTPSPDTVIENKDLPHTRGENVERA